MRIVIFGTGKFYNENKHHIKDQDCIIAFLDNNKLVQGQQVDGITIYAPHEIHNQSYDKVVLMSIHAAKMKKQLLELGVSEDRIWTWRRYESEYSRGVLKLFCHREKNQKFKKSILLLSTDLNYNGGSIAAVNAVRALQLQGYRVILATPFGDEKFMNEVSRQDVNIVLCPAINYLEEEEKYWIEQFDIVIVNVFQMISCACEISKFKPVLWWIHEPSMSYSNIYERIQVEFSQYNNLAAMERVNVAAVSKIAKTNFEEYYPEKVKYVLPYGIPDEYVSDMDGFASEKITFAIIGAIEERKDQKTFIQAVLKFTSDERNRLEFLIIGADSSDAAYCNEIRELSKEVPQIKLMGRLTREEMKKIYSKIDVVVCASLEETMSLKIT